MENMFRGMEIMIKVLVLILTTYNYNTGDLLFFSAEMMDPKENCIELGTVKAKEISQKFRVKGLDNASTNVQCRYVEVDPKGPIRIVE